MIQDCWEIEDADIRQHLIDNEISKYIDFEDPEYSNIRMIKLALLTATNLAQTLYVEVE